MSSKFYITTPIYYVNAKPHIGSAYTTIAADVLARWHRQKGDDVWFLTGTDEHGAKIAAAAEAAGKTAQEFADEIAKDFKQAWDVLNISYNDFIRTTEDRHKKVVTRFLNKLKDSGKIYEGEYEGLYCVGHEAFIKESDLVDGVCPDHKTKPEKVKEKNWFFKLSEYGNEIKNRIESKEFVIEPESRRNEVLSFIDQGLEDIAISRPNVTWGIPIPWDKSQTVYVWVDALCNYLSASTYWPADLHLVGKDIIKFHCIIWPALLEAIGEKWPRKVFAHGYFTVDGKKMSKSLGNVVDPIQVAEEYGADVLRYFILRDIPFGNDGDFSHERLKNRYNADLANGLGNLVSRTLNMIEKFWPDFDNSHIKPTAVDNMLTHAEAVLEKNAFDVSLAKIWDVIAWADLLIESSKPWELARKGDIDRLKEVLGQLFEALLGISKSITPFMPETHEKLTKLLAVRPLKKPNEPLFARK